MRKFTRVNLSDASASSLRFSGAVLAGGRSTRMGTDKALLQLPGGESLLAHGVNALRTAGASEVLVSLRVDQRYGILGAREVHDPAADSGPLAGIVSVLAAAKESLVFVLAVDLAAVTPAFLLGLVKQATPGCGVIPEDVEGLQPLAAIYPVMAAARAQRALAERRLSLRAFATELEREGLMRRVALDAVAATELRNCNTPEQWAQWRA